MKKIGEKKFAVPAVIIIIIALSVLISMPVACVSAEKEAAQKTKSVKVTEEAGTNVEKYGFTFELLKEEVAFPLQLKKDFLDKGFTFMRYDEIKKVYQNKTADTWVTLENVDKNIMFGKSFFSTKISDSDKPENSVESTDITGIAVGALRSDVFSINGYGCGDKMKSLLNAFGNGYTVISKEGATPEEGRYSVEYIHGNTSVKITSEDGEIIALNAEYIRSK